VVPASTHSLTVVREGPADAPLLTLCPLPPGAPPAPNLVPARVCTTTTYGTHCDVGLTRINISIPIPHLRITTGPSRVTMRIEYLDCAAKSGRSCTPSLVVQPRPAARPAPPAALPAAIGPGRPVPLPAATAQPTAWRSPPPTPERCAADARHPAEVGPELYEDTSKQDTVVPAVRR
jgi:hypothetical protein